MSSTESIRGSLDDDLSGGMRLDVLQGSYFVSVFTFLLILAQYKWRRHRFLQPPEAIQVEVEIPRAPNQPGVC
jgi:hypothetical protein